MNNFTKCIAIAGLSLMIFSCSDEHPASVEYTPEVTQIKGPNYELGEPKLAEDTIPTIEIITEDSIPTFDMSAPEEIVITMSEEGVTVDADNYSSNYKRGNYSRVTVARKGAEVNHVKVDNTIIFKAPTTKYIYLDASTIEVQPGNTLFQIIKDHQDEGYSINLTKIINLNQYLKSRGKEYRIFPGDRIYLGS